MTPAVARIVLALLLATPQRPSRPATVPVGERLSYQVSWSQIDAAHAVFTVAAGATPETVSISLEGETVNLAKSLYDAGYTASAECDRATYLPRQIQRRFREGSKEHEETVRFLRAQKRIESGARQAPMDANAHDALTLLYALRQVRFGALGSVTRYVLADLTTMYDAEAKVAGRADGQVEIDLVATARRPPRARSEYRLRIEETGSHRVTELKTRLPIGEVVVSLVP